MNTILEGAREALYMERLRQIMIHNGFYEAALEIKEICRGLSAKQISDKVEMWKSYDGNIASN